MDVRPASPSDAEFIRRVSARSCRAAYQDILDDETLIEVMEDPAMSEHIREWLEETGDDERVVYLVATEADELVGFTQFLIGDRALDRTDPNEAYLKSLYVLPDHWGNGVGSDLLSAGIEQLPEPIVRLSLGVLVDNDIGRKFYEKHGFEQVDTGSYEVDGVSYSTVLYETQLDSS